MIKALASWHHFIVHFAVALSLMSIVFDLSSVLLRKPGAERFGFVLMLAAVPFLLFAVLTGNLAEPFVRSGELSPIVDRHESYANIAVWTFLAAGFWRVFLHVKHRYAAGRKILYILIAVAAGVAVFLAAREGGKIRHKDFQDPPRPESPAVHTSLRSEPPDITERTSDKRAIQDSLV